MNSSLSPYPVACHTDNVGPGTIFVSIQGTRENGALYIISAVQKGARQIVIEEGVPIDAPTRQVLKAQNIPCIRVKNARRALAELSAKQNGYPAQKLSIIGITGTKGKTSSAFLLRHILYKAGYKTALLTTIGNMIGNVHLTTHNTTPQPDYLHAFFRRCCEENVDYVIMEVAAQAVTLFRVEGILFDLIIFTNFEPEHGEFYATVNEYFAAKKALLQQCTTKGTVLLNMDCSFLKPLLLKHAYKSFGKTVSADYSIQTDYMVAATIQHNMLSSSFSFSQFFGDAMLSNCVSALAGAHCLGISLAQGISFLHDAPSIPGRFFWYPLKNGAAALIDYAHTPRSYYVLLHTVRQRTPHLVVVFGAGGDRDMHKRPLMGKLVGQYADCAIITNDNPRTEDPHTIIQHIYSGILKKDRKKIVCIPDRAQAICYAYKQSKKNTIILLLGKGSDCYQIIGNKKIPFFETKILDSCTKT